MDGTPRERIGNRGGDYVRDVMVVRTVGGHVLQVRGPANAIKQICLTDPRYVPTKSPQPRRLTGVGAEPTQATSQLLALLGTILTLPCETGLDFALALDWYKVPMDGRDPRSWQNTPTGNLVSRGKYWYRSPGNAGKQRACGRALVKRLVAVVNRHPLLRDVDAIAAAPGHDSKVVSFGARLATAVAGTLGKPLIMCSGLADFRAPAKGQDPVARAAMLHRQFVCHTHIARQSLLIVDDVYSSGSTANETARALRAAGAEHVTCLCAVRTMRL